MTEQDLADRLGKAKVVQADCPHFFQNDEGPGWSCDEDHNGGHCLCRDWIREIDELASLRRSAPEVSSVRVERVQMTRIVGGIDWAEREPADPTWRVIIGERCFDFETETEANNLKLAIDELAATRSAPASGEMREAVLAEIAALVRGVVYAEHYRAWPTLEVENRRNTDRVTVQCDVLADAIYALRTPSGETREEAGS